MLRILAIPFSLLDNTAITPQIGFVDPTKWDKYDDGKHRMFVIANDLALLPFQAEWFIFIPKKSSCLSRNSPQY